jgi:hypothetical protein
MKALEVVAGTLIAVVSVFVLLVSAVFSIGSIGRYFRLKYM